MEGCDYRAGKDAQGPQTTGCSDEGGGIKGLLQGLQGRMVLDAAPWLAMVCLFGSICCYFDCCVDGGGSGCHCNRSEDGIGDVHNAIGRRLQ